MVATDSFRHKGKTDRIAQVLKDRGDWQARTTVITHDLSAPFSLQSLRMMERAGAVDHSPVNYVIAYASDSHVDRSIADPVPFVSNNTAIALTTLELCRELQPDALLWVSTDEVYGPQADGQPPFPEWSPILPSNPYSASKAAQEALAISYWRTYKVPLVIVNAMNMIGERQDPEKFVPQVISKLIGGDEITIHGTPGNVGTRHYLHARNVADAIVFLLNRRSVQMFPRYTLPDRFNIASPDRIDNLRLAQMISEIMDRPLNHRFENFHATRPGHDPHYGLDPAKLTALGWRPPVSFDESLARTVMWSWKNPDWLEE